MERREFLKNTAIIGAVALSTAPLLNAGTAKAEEPIHELKDPNNPSTLEKKHVPLVQAPKRVKKGEWFDVTVKVGYMLPHPSTPGHWIDDIKLLVNGKEVSEIENKAGGTTSSDGCFKIRIEAPAVLEAIAHCNLHGTWRSAPVKVAV